MKPDDHREQREATQQTQVEVASRLHVSQRRISALERGDIERSQIETLPKYAEALGGTLHVEVRIDDKSFLSPSPCPSTLGPNDSPKQGRNSNWQVRASMSARHR